MKKYKIDRDLSKIARQKAPSNIYLYPIVNMVMKFTTFVIEPQKCNGILPSIIFYHGGGVLLKASKAHYQIAKWYAEMAKCKVVFADYCLKINILFLLKIATAPINGYLTMLIYPVTDRRMISVLSH